MKDDKRLMSYSASDLKFEHETLGKRRKEIKTDTYFWCGFCILTAGLDIGFVVVGFWQMSNLRSQMTKVERIAKQQYGIDNIKTYEPTLVYSM